MNKIFAVLYQVHPWLPAIYLIIFAVGLIGPATYCAFKKLPYSIELIWKNAKSNDIFAKLIMGAYFLLAALTTITLITSFTL